ncbi:MAG: ABC transporter ATP-binding protein, partial [Pseudorhodoplanes sp.]
ADRRAALAPLRKRITEAEAVIKRLTADIAGLDVALAQPDLFARDPAKAAGLAKDRSERAAALVRAEEEWLAASSDYESAMA